MSFSFSALAMPTALVKKIKGKVTFNNTQLKEGDVIDKTGELITGKKSFVKIDIAHWGNSIVLGAGSKMKLDLSAKTVKKKYSFMQGICRWKTVVGLKTGPKDKKGGIHTKTAIIGVRGTDFLLKVNPMLDETEVVVFDGQVEFANAVKGTEKILVKKGQWGGVGGRYGQKVSPAFTLPEKAFSSFNKKLNL